MYIEVTPSSIRSSGERGLESEVSDGGGVNGYSSSESVSSSQCAEFCSILVRIDWAKPDTDSALFHNVEICIQEGGVVE